MVVTPASTSKKNPANVATYRPLVSAQSVHIAVRLSVWSHGLSGLPTVDGGGPVWGHLKHRIVYR